MKKKLFLVTDCFPYGSGEKTFILSELPFLLKEFDVTIISCASEESKNDNMSLSKLPTSIKLISIPLNKKDIKTYTLFFCFFRSFFLFPLWKELCFIFRSKRKIFLRSYLALRFLIIAECFYHSLKKNVHIDNAIIYTYWNNEKTLSFCLNKKVFKNCKIITRVHGYDLYKERSPGERQYFRWFVNKKIDSIFFISNNSLEYYRNNYLGRCYNKNLLHVCPLGVDDVRNSTSLTRNEKEFVIVSCSSIIPLKRIDLIVRGMDLVDPNISIRWIHFGDGIDYDFIKSLANCLFSKHNNIIYEFKGNTENSEIRRFYSSCYIDCFITTSSTEGLPVSIQEALCSSIPIIATNVGGISETIEENGILLSPSPSPIEVASAIESMARLSNTQKDILRKNSRKIWENKFNSQKNYNYLISILRNIL